MNYSQQEIQDLTQMAKRMRLAALDMTLSTGQGGAHLGGGMSCMEILAVLYGKVMKFDVQNPLNKERDRFLPSKNHCVLAHLPALAEVGYISREELCEFQKNGGRLTSYPKRPEIGLEYAGGSLGMALALGIGIALSARQQQKKNTIYVLLGDGELNEGSNWEAFMAAGHYRLNNLVAIIDRNHLAYDGNTEEVMGLESLQAKLESFRWQVSCCDGHKMESLLTAFADRAGHGPQVILADTVKGKGVSFMENRPEWHHHVLTQEQYEQAKKEIMES